MNNEVLKAIADRRSIRAYTDRPVNDEELGALISAATQAPSAVNRQPYHFTFVRDKAVLDEFCQAWRNVSRQLNPDSPPSEDFNVFRGAPCVCFIFCDPLNSWSLVDSGIAVENLALAAHSMGLGSVILGMPKMLFEAAGEAWLQKLDCPAGMRFSVAIGIGTPAAGKDAHPVREGLVTVKG